MPTIDPTVLAMPAAVAGLAIVATAAWALRRADRRQLLVLVVSLLAVGIGLVAFESSLTKLTHLAGGNWGPGLALEGGLFVATIVELSKNAKGMTAPPMRRLTWVLLAVTMTVNASGEDTVAKMLLAGVLPLVWKFGAVGGLKTLLLEMADVQLEDRLPALRWAQAPVSTFWCWRQKVLGRVQSYAAALAIDTDVAVRDIDLRERRAEKNELRRWQRRPSARDLALRDAITAAAAEPEPKRRTGRPARAAAPTSSPSPAPTAPPNADPASVVERERGDDTLPLRPLPDPDAPYEVHVEAIGQWLADRHLTPTVKAVQSAAKAMNLPYARAEAASAVNKDLKVRAAAS